MESSRQKLHFRPFEVLELLARVPDIQPAREKAPVSPSEDPPQVTTAGEETLFREAMDGVIPLEREAIAPEGTDKSRKFETHTFHRCQDGEALDALRKLVSGGGGFDVAHTPEYIEGRPYHDVHAVITEKLHRGEFAVQDHIDLHGLTLEAAENELGEFFSRAVKRGARMVLVIHGRGKSSPVKPVLKSMVREWLTTGPFRAWIIAYSSARLCDGGAGATYVLLRHRPLTKRGKRRRGRGNQT